MKNKKNIDRLFQEQFKDFEIKPNIEVWKNIELALRDKKNKKRIIPFWYKFSGVAAVLLIAFFAIYNNINFGKDQFQLQKPTSISKDNNNNLVDSEKAAAKKQIQNSAVKEKNKNNNIVKSDNAVAKKQIQNSIRKEKNNNNAIVSFDKVVMKKQKQLQKSASDPSGQLRNPTSEKEIANVVTNASLGVDKKLITSNNDKSESKTNDIKNVLGNDKNSVAEVLETKKTNLKNEDSDNLNIEKNSFSNIAENNIEKLVDNKKTDSIIVALKKLNPLEELQLKKDAEKKKIVPKSNKWQITSNVAPVFFNSNVKESPIDPVLNSYNKTFETNLSLGFGMGYAISKKLSIRSGVNKFVMSYSTNDVFFRAGLGKPATMQNMTNANNGAGLEIVSRSSAMNPSAASEISAQIFSEGSISQRMGYFEVPLELSYAVLNKKFSIDLIGGFSTLFLAENEILMQSEAMTSNLGQANNLRDVHFSSNFGVGFRYQFWKSFQARLEPTFKYQINTFTDNSLGFRPYFIGVYSGISFGF